MRYRDRAVYADGRHTDLTGREADDRYAPFGPFRTVGAELVFLSDVDVQLVGDDQEWDRIAVVRYPTRRSFLEMQELPEYVELHEHKDAGMASTFVIAGRPVTRPRTAGRRRRPSTRSPIRRPPRTDRSSSSTCSGTTTDEFGGHGALHGRGRPHRLPHGIPDRRLVGRGGHHRGRRPRLGSGPVQRVPVAKRRSWPWLSIRMRLTAQADHREPAIADTYTLLLRPVIDRLADSIGS